ncbi:MAG: hypothetical protein WDO24_10915 [Pseudomonadota bacterium]
MTDAIIDAHHHIWRLADLPWLAGPPVPRISATTQRCAATTPSTSSSARFGRRAW